MNLEEKPILSVILPVYNQEPYLAETIESVLAQSFKNFEFIIWDDGSTDQSAAIIKNYAKSDSRIRAYFEKNSGKSNATNKIVQCAQANLCVFLDADDVMLPDRLQHQIKFHQDNPGIHASSGHCYYINEKGNLYGTQRYPGLRTIEQCSSAAATREFITCSFTALTVNKDAYLNSGGLQKRFEPCEDFEFLNRFINKGYILLINPVVMMKYRIHAAAITVKRPILIYDTISYVKYCFDLKWNNKPEITFNEFQEIQKKFSWWTKFNRRRFNYSRILFRNAGFAMLSRDYMSFAWQIATSLVLSPHYFFKKINNFSKKN